jgi:acyl-CoA synthetase (AMP-forming)/AMP-acid ligase II
MKNNIIFKIRDGVLRHSERIAVIEKQGKDYQQITFSQFWEDVKSIGHFLSEKGIKKGDKVVVFVPMSTNLYKIILGLYYIGATVVFMDAWITKERLQIACDIAKPAGFIGIPKAHLLRFLSPAIRKIPVKIIVKKNFKFKPAPENFEPVETELEDTALVSFTTGSTGVPKATRRTHDYIWQTTLAMQKHHPLAAGEVDMPILPLFMGNNLLQGVTTVIPDFNPAKPADINPETITKQIQKFGVTTSLGSPAFYDKLADYLLERNITLDIKTIFMGGAPVFPPLAEKLVKAFPKTRVEVVYGSSEAEPIASILADEVAKSNILDGLAVGKKVDFIDMKILKPVDGPLELKEGETLENYLAGKEEVGEIIVSGAHVLKEYLNSPEAFRENKIVEGDKIWHRTGDAGIIDKEGNVLLFGRVKNRFQYQDKWLYTLPLEQKLLELKDKIRFATVVGKNGKIYVLLEPMEGTEKIDADFLKNEAAKMLDGIRVDEFKILEKIPRDPRHHSKPNYAEINKILS